MLQQPKSHFDTGPARQYGEVIYLFHGRMTPYDNDFAEQLLAALHREDFCDNQDFLCCTGGVNGLVAAAAVMAGRFDELNLLMYDPVRGEYCPKKVVCR